MSLLDPKWKYTHSTATDIRKTFAKARRDIAKKQQPSARPPKLQLMRAPGGGATFGSLGDAPRPLRYSSRSTATDRSAEHPTVEHSAPATRSDRLVAS